MKTFDKIQLELEKVPQRMEPVDLRVVAMLEAICKEIDALKEREPKKVEPVISPSIKG